jgi:hypothetical protein
MNNTFEIKNERIYNVTGRGTILIVDLYKNKLTQTVWIDEIPIKIRDQIKTSNKLFEVRGIESQRNLMNSNHHSSIGIVVKEIE